MIELRDQNPDRAVILVTKDINLRIKASINGIVAEDYENDRALDDFSLLYTGSAELSEDFWDKHPEVQSWTERGRTFYEEWIASEDEKTPGSRTNACSYPARTTWNCACCASTMSAPRWCCWTTIRTPTITSGALARATASRTSRSTH